MDDKINPEQIARQEMPLPEFKSRPSSNKSRYGMVAILLLVLTGGLLYLVRSWYAGGLNPGNQPTPTPENSPSPLPQVSVAITVYETIPADFIQNIPSPETITIADKVLTQSYGVIENTSESGLEILVSVAPKGTFERLSLTYKGETRWATANFGYSEGVFMHLAKEYIKFDDFISRLNKGEYVRVLYEANVDGNIAFEVVLLQD